MEKINENDLKQEFIKKAKIIVEELENGSDVIIKKKKDSFKIYTTQIKKI